MTIKDKKERNKLIVLVNGRIDTNTAPELNDYFEASSEQKFNLGNK